MQRMLAEDLAERLAERAFAGAPVADEHERDLGLLVWMPHRPSEPIHDVAINVFITRRQRFEDVFAQQTPVALLGLDAPSGPEIEPTIDDGLASRTEDDAGVLSPMGMLEPPTPKVDPLRSILRFDLNAAIEVEVSEVAEAQERRHEINVALAAGDMLDLLEAQDHRFPTVEHHAIVDVELGEPLRPLGLGLFLFFVGRSLAGRFALFGRLRNELVQLLARTAGSDPVGEVLLWEHDDAHARGDAA